MDKLYERADIYDLLENEQRWQGVLRHWQTLLDGKDIASLLDVSIGTGNLTLPLCELGVRLTGSDLNPAMLHALPGKGRCTRLFTGACRM